MKNKTCECAKILVCDDDAMNTWVISEMLASLGFKSTVVNGGKECLKILKNKTNLRCCNY